MTLIINDAVRKNIEISLELAQFLPELNNQNLKLETIDAFCQVLIIENQENIQKIIAKELSEEVSVAHFGAMTCGFLSITILDTPILPLDWASTNCVPNPNLVIGHMLVHVANSILAIIHLIDAGLESSARIQLRNLLELTWLILVILSKREKMMLYTQGTDDESERKLYFQHFSPKKLRDQMIQIEEDSGFSSNVMKKLSDLRSSLYSMYSKSVHNAYTDTVIGALGFSFKEDDKLNFGLFGIADKASYPTLYHLNDALFYFFSMFRRVLEEVHGLEPPYSLQWQKTLALYESFSFVAMNRSKRDDF